MNPEKYDFVFFKEKHYNHYYSLHSPTLSKYEMWKRICKTVFDYRDHRGDYAHEEDQDFLAQARIDSKEGNLTCVREFIEYREDWQYEGYELCKWGPNPN